MASRVGSWLRGKYHLDRELGEGGMAVVYEATHRNKKRFAVKMLRPELSTVGDVRTRFLREGYVANSVDHPGVVAVLDDDVTEDGCAFLVMELLDGASVERIAEDRGGTLGVEPVLAIAHGLCDALVSAHAKNIVHRDLKPANLFVTRGGMIKVLDFGIARIRDAQLTTTTNTGLPMGTPAFMGPEQARGKSSLIGPKSDLWSTGATMFTLLTNQNVHSGETAQEVVFHAASEPARSLATAMPDAPAEVVAIVDRALAFSPDDRWENAAAMRDAIARAYEALYKKPISTDAAASLVRESGAMVAGHSPGADLASAPTIAMASLGRTTAQPVSSVDLQAPPKSRRPLFIALGGVLAAATIAGGVVVATGALRTPASASRSPVETITASPPPTPSPTMTMTIASSLPIATTSIAPTASASATTKATVTRPPPKNTASASRPRDTDFDRR